MEESEAKPMEKPLYVKGELISQSTLKLVLSYLKEGECGKVVQAKLQGKFPYKLSSAFQQGIYFEYRVLGTVPKYYMDKGILPEPEWMKSALSKPLDQRKVSDMTAPYRSIETAAQKVKDYLHKMGITILNNNESIINNEYKIVGEIDARATGTILGGEAIIDTKWTGLLDDKWNKWGWAMTNTQKEFHSIQAKHYHLLTGLPFYYLVVGSSKDESEDSALEIRFIKAEFTDEGLVEHLTLVDQVRNLIKINNLMDEWEARPEIRKCEKCALFESCTDKAWHPEIQSINF